ncbi:MAG: Rieske 2Fe-2S domain-containing protein [Psychrobium sp.]|nr:Rieske 2Fe-2S domain-containing protein [Psychrobium sp.]
MIKNNLLQSWEERYQLPSFPKGWYAVAWETHINEKDIINVNLCGQKLVVFKTESGEVSVLSAHCPHLGAHLGYGGVVEKDRIRCPFHSWEFGTCGKCVKTPFINKPVKATVRKWYHQVANGMLLVWYSQDKKEPDWFVDEVDTAGWTLPIFHEENTWRLRTHIQEVAENGVDTHHFVSVHNAQEPGTLANVDFSTHVGKWVSHSNTLMMGEQVSVVATLALQGLGVEHVYVNIPEKSLEFRTYIYITPVDKEYIDIRMAISVKCTGREGKDKTLLRILTPKLTNEIKQDFDIWEHKIYHEKPRLSPTDGPIHALRCWANQFYE